MEAVDVGGFGISTAGGGSMEVVGMRGCSMVFAAAAFLSFWDW